METRPPSDQQAIERYRYMLRTAPPETIEQAHAEAFARLTEPQRRMVLEQLREAAPGSERGTATTSDPQALARMATRAEIREPGALERILGPARGGGFGGMLAGSLLGSLAGTVLGSMVAQHFFAEAAAAEAPPAGGFGQPSAIEEIDSEEEEDFDEDAGDDMDIDV
jgi:anti-sigma factor RsiW